MSSQKYIASLDVGTTTVRCIIFDSSMKIKGSALEKVELLSPEPGYFEINPAKLWESIVTVIRDAIKVARLTAADITCLGISTQRCTFITWDKETEECFHNFITWKDLRADSLVKKWNTSFTMGTLNRVSYAMYLLSRSKRFLAGSVIKMMNGQVTLRLVYQITHNAKVKRAIENKTAVFGTLDSWLLYKLRKGDSNVKVEHISDITSCTATGLYDPFTLGWATWAFSLFSLKKEMMPRVVDSSYNFGSTHASIFGAPIKIASSMSDQSCSLWGSCCFGDGDIKVTLGTGSFLNINTKKTCHASVHGLYPLVAWRKVNEKTIEEEDLCYCVEGSVNDTGTIINWAISFGLFDNPAQSSSIAESVPDTDGVVFIPAFSGLGPPINDTQAGTGFIGIRPTTTRAHLVRAILESIAFRVAQLYNCSTRETSYKSTLIKVAGGVSKNDFICQTIADITGLKVERPTMTESSALGAAFVAGIISGIWRNKSDLEKFYIVDRVFSPRNELRQEYDIKMKLWEQGAERFKGWYA